MTAKTETATKTETRYSVFALDAEFRIWDERDNRFVENPATGTADFDSRFMVERHIEDLNNADAQKSRKAAAESRSDEDGDEPNATAPVTAPAAPVMLGHLPKQPRRTCGKVGPTMSVARRRAVLTALVERVNSAARVLTVARFLAEHGASAELIRSYASGVGRAAAKAYRAAVKAEPARSALALVGHHLARVFAYTETDRPLLNAVLADYEVKTPVRARLLDLIGA